MNALVVILFVSVAGAIGAVSGWSAYLRRTSGPQDALLVWRFVFHLWLLVTCFGIVFVITPEDLRDWLVVPPATAGLLLIFRFRQRRREVQNAESYLDPRKRDGFWIKKIR